MRSSLRYVSFWVASSCPVFFLLNSLPGDVTSFFVDLKTTQEQVAIIKESLGLNEPIVLRYLKWVTSLGLNQDSLVYHMPVWQVLSEGLSKTVAIGALSTALSFSVGLALGIWAGFIKARNCIILTQVTYAMPAFLLALLLVSLIPETSGSVVFAGLCLSVGQASLLAWVAYQETGKVLSQEYIFFALKRASLPVYKILYRHVTPHVVVALLGVMSLQFAFLMSGTIIVEKPFGIAGLGSTLLHALNTRDIPVLQTGIWFIIGIVLFSRYVSELIIDLMTHE